VSRADVLELMRTRLGLDASSLGERVLDDACAEARRSAGVGSDAELYQRLLMDGETFARCSEHFVVPESWFFRTREQFDDLVRFARDHLAHQQRPLRILSLPCAAGEEAYSAVIALLDAGLHGDQIDVLGIDISQEALSRAEAGHYRPNAMRGTVASSVWLHPADGGFRVDDAVRACARFRRGNALDPLLLHGDAAFDVVFCRNLLIYLHADARQRVVATLLEKLHVPGLILAGQAEVLSTLSDQLQPLEGGCPLSFVRRPATQPARVETTDTARARAAQAAMPSGDSPSSRLPSRSGLANTTGPREASPTPSRDAHEGSLAEAHRLANAGQTELARTRCLDWLRQHPADVEAHFLLGLLESASGNPEAADRAFTRVLYLDRDHADALHQRIGLAERRGARAQANELRARAVRLRAGKESSP